MAEKRALKKMTEKIKEGNERGARESLLEDLFYDFNRNRVQIYKMNFFRGIFFGLGSVLGGTVIVALIVWMLSFFVNIPGIGDQIQNVEHSIQGQKK